MLRVMLWVVFIVLGLSVVVAAVSWRKSAKIAQTHPPVGDFLEIDGQKIHYLKRGSGPVMILLHGAGGNLRDWTYATFDHWAQDHTVIAFDRPGYGYSADFDRSGASLELQSRVLLNAAKELGVTEATLVGYSFGGAVATHMALDDPEFVKDMLLIAPVLHSWPNDTVGWEHPMLSIPVIGPAIMHTVFALRGDGYFRPLYEGVFRPQSPPSGYIEHVGLGLSVNPRVQVQNSRQIMPLADQIRAIIPRYKELELRVEIVHGDQDSSVSAVYHAQDFIKDAPNADVNLTLIPGMGHGVHQLSLDEIYAARLRLNQPRS